MTAAIFTRGVSVTFAASAPVTAPNCYSRPEPIRPCRSSLANAAARCSFSISGSCHSELFTRLVSSGKRSSAHSARASLQPPEAGTEQAKQLNTSSNSGESEGSSEKRSSTPPIKNELNEAVRKTAATFAPRASTASKNPAPPGSTLYKVFEAQAYVAMVAGGALSFNLLFPSDHPDIWRLMGMWSIWMFTVPSLRARDCSKKEKEALNYLFLAIPLINVTLPLVWKSFAAVWSTDVLAFLAIYAWKMEWFSPESKVEDS